MRDKSSDYEYLFPPDNQQQSSINYQQSEREYSQTDIHSTSSAITRYVLSYRKRWDKRTY